MTTSLIYSVQNLSVLKPGGTGEKILDDVNLNVHEGDFLVLLGPNGSGKSSLMKVMNGLWKQYDGLVHLDQKDLKSYGTQNFYKIIGTLNQDVRESTFSSLSVFENCVLADSKAHFSPLRSVECHLKKAFLKDHVSKFNSKLGLRFDSLVGKLSGGERQALALGLAFLHPPKVLFLDEHTSALDPKTGDDIMELTSEWIKRLNMTVIMTTHNLDHALAYGNKILALKQGKVRHYFDKPSALTKESLFETCY